MRKSQFVGREKLDFQFVLTMGGCKNFCNGMVRPAPLPVGIIVPEWELANPFKRWHGTNHGQV
ncbi:hypothetical protein AL013_13745 [Mariprofundus ferrooxydans]|nr:hypothetical protein AL013_13745 [Mariprofundus ferrooxydans]